tara:strand:+ start:114 stop:911 length:798 start_codon:yes stop_codon:yes gene_type:complete
LDKIIETNKNPIGFQTILSRELMRFITLYRQTIVPNIISSALYLIVFGAAMGSRISSIPGYEEFKYIHFIIPGLVMMAVINPAYQNSSSSLMQAKFLKFIDDVLITPISGFELCLCYTLGGVARGLVNGIMVLAVCYMFDPFKIAHPIYCILFLVLVSWTFSALGVIIGVFAKTWDSIMVFTNFVFTPLIFLGGVFYSIEMIPVYFLQIISKINPVYWMIHGLRFSILDKGDIPVLYSLGIVAIFALIFTILATYLFDKGIGIKN